jgi:lysophospholipase L1-like esterase
VYSLLTCAAICLNLAASAGPSSEDFFLKDGEKVVFFGDSITQVGLYVEYVEAYLLTRFPEKHFQIINRGISSETISGTSEADHHPRRPNAQDRFTRDVATARPDVIVACFGINDGNYHPFEPERFNKFQEGIRRLIARTREETKARLVILTPPPFDPYQRLVLDPEAKEFGYKYPAIDYDDTIEHYSQWLMTLREPNVLVADIHAAMKSHLRERRVGQVSFGLQTDGIHPTPTGHWLMAQTLLAAWKAPALCAEARIDAAGLKATAGEVTNLHREEGGVAFTWRTPLPMPMDPRWDARSLEIERIRERFNVYQLRIEGLAAGRYVLLANKVKVANVGQEQLARGLDLLDYPAFPAVDVSQRLLGLLHDRHQRSYIAWRKRIGTSAPADEDILRRTPGELDRRAAEIDRAIRVLCEPTPIRIAIEAIGPQPAGR